MMTYENGRVLMSIDNPVAVLATGRCCEAPRGRGGCHHCSVICDTNLSIAVHLSLSEIQEIVKRQ